MTTTSGLVDPDVDPLAEIGGATGGRAASDTSTDRTRPDAASVRRARVGAGDRPRANRSPAAQRAIDRRRRRTAQRRTPVLVAAPQERAALVPRLVHGSGTLVRRMPFAVVVVLVLAAGLALTLWLSTTAAQDSYRLTSAREQHQALLERRDALKKSFESSNSASELSQRATQLGMIPATDVPRMVVGRDGKVHVVGEVAPATGPPAPALNGSSRQGVTPQPGASTSGNTAQAPASAAPSASGDTGAPTSNVLPGATSAPNTSTSAPSDGSVPNAPADRPGAAAPTSAPGNTPGGTDSSVPR